MQIKDAHSPMCPDKVPQKHIYYKKRFIFDFLKSVWLNPGLKQPFFFFFIGTVARLHPSHEIFYDWPLHIWALVAFLGFYFPSTYDGVWRRVTWSAFLMWAKVITAIAITIITYGFSMTRWISNWKALMVGFRTVDFSKRWHRLQPTRSEVAQFSKHWSLRAGNSQISFS